MNLCITLSAAGQCSLTDGVSPSAPALAEGDGRDHQEQA